MTFSATYLCWGTLLLSSKGILSKAIYRNSAYNTFLHVLGGSMPSIMGIAFTGYFGGVKKIKQLLKKLTNWKFNIAFYLLSLITLNAQLFLSYFICSIIGFNIKVFVNSSFQGFKTDSVLGIFALFIVIVYLEGLFKKNLVGGDFYFQGFRKNFIQFIQL